MTELREYLGFQLHQREAKPRSKGLTHVIDNIGHPLSYLKDYLEECAPYIDCYKLYIGLLFQATDLVRKKIELLASHGVKTQPSGTYAEIARTRGHEYELLKQLRDLGVTTAEVSASTGTAREIHEQVEFANMAKDRARTEAPRNMNRARWRDSSRRKL